MDSLLISPDFQLKQYLEHVPFRCLIYKEFSLRCVDLNAFRFVFVAAFDKKINANQTCKQELLIPKFYLLDFVI